MRLLVSGTIVITLIVAFFACSKSSGDESDLYGTWVKGSNLGDTLWFMKKDGKHIMRQPESFNPLMPLYSEKEYRFKDGKLSIKIGQEYSPADSFTWTQAGQEFTILNISLFMFMSSMITYKYQKI